MTVWVHNEPTLIGALALALLLSLSPTKALRAERESAPEPVQGTPNESIQDELLYLKMSQDDVLLANSTVQAALESSLSGETLSWKNTATGSSGSVTPLTTYRSKSGFFCRAYRETLTIGSYTELYRDTACRDADRVWKPISQ